MRPYLMASSEPSEQPLDPVDLERIHGKLDALLEAIDELKSRLDETGDLLDEGLRRLHLREAE